MGRVLTVVIRIVQIFGVMFGLLGFLIVAIATEDGNFLTAGSFFATAGVCIFAVGRYFLGVTRKERFDADYRPIREDLILRNGLAFEFNEDRIVGRILEYHVLPSMRQFSTFLASPIAVLILIIIVRSNDFGEFLGVAITIPIFLSILFGFLIWFANRGQKISQPGLKLSIEQLKEMRLVMQKGDKFITIDSNQTSVGKELSGHMIIRIQRERVDDVKIVSGSQLINLINYPVNPMIKILLRFTELYARVYRLVVVFTKDQYQFLPESDYQERFEDIDPKMGELIPFAIVRTNRKSDLERFLPMFQQWLQQ